MRVLVLGLLLSISSWTVADVLDVNIWKAMPGKNRMLVKYAAEAQAIQQKLGANASVGRDMEGRIHTVTNFKNWAEWAAFGEKLQGSSAWGKFLDKIDKNPSAELEDNYLLNTPLSGGSGGEVYQVFIWKAELGRADDMFQSGMEAAAIHKKAGISVDIHVDQMQNMHYALNFDSWADWAKMQDTPNAEFQAFMQRQGADPTAQLIKVYTANNL
jgi:hypothetical protein